VDDVGETLMPQATETRADRLLFDHLLTGAVLEDKPALSALEARQGQDTRLTAEEAGELLRSIESETVLGLRDRAMIGVMVFTIARPCAA
jgi:integrase/recombinase XerD